MEKGIILKGIGGFYYVKTRLGTIECRARGKFRKDSLKPLCGDIVDIELTDEKIGTVCNIYDRKNSFVRPPVANIDLLVIVMAVKNPEPDFLFVDKMTVIGKYNNTDVVICFNKCDLNSDTDYISEIYKNTGFKLFFTSAKNNAGTDDLKKEFADKTTAFAGGSGVGKSSLLNLLADMNFETGDVSKKLKRGRHTTRCVEFFEYGENSYLADTPGFSMLDLPKIKAGELENYFPEFEPYLNHCRFNGCSHVAECGCGIKEAVENGKISKSRYESYKTFYERLNSVKEW